MMARKLCVATFNVRGCNDDEKRKSISRDAERYKIDIMGITETRIKREEVEEISKAYNIYHNGIQEGEHAGVGIVIRNNIHVKFQRINDRICTAEIELGKNRKLVFIVAYAPTQIRSEKNEELRENFYETLNEITRKMNKGRHLVIIAGDFNAKTGSARQDFPENIGKYGKGHANSNGICLLEFAKENNMYLTNTTFEHKLTHRTTWISSQKTKDHNDKSGTTRRNPYRNQIDYILTKCNHRRLVRDARSYSGIETQSDHKIVITKLETNWWEIRKKGKTQIRVDLEKFKDNNKRDEYREMVKSKIEEQIQHKELSLNKKWECIGEICKTSAEETLGKKTPHNRNHDHPEIKSLSKKQKALAQEIESIQNNKKLRKTKKKERNNILNNIKDKIKTIVDQQYEEELREIENTGTTQKAYDAMKAMRRRKPQKKIKVFDENGNLTNSEKQQVEIITNIFKETFEIPNITDTKHYPPCPNPTKFTKEEIAKTVKKLKNGKSPGIDDVNPELMKYAPEILHEELAQILDKTVESDDKLDMLKMGILNPLQKPPKKGFERKTNVRPIILLSIIRKIFAICIINRIWNKIKEKIPIDQAAYQGGRSTTEQVFTVKVLAEKAIACDDYEILLLLIDMSKAFDTVDRNTLLLQLEEHLDEAEMRMMYLLITDVKLKVRLGKETGEEIATNIGVAQGDCLSAILFIFYLAHFLTPLPPGQIREDFKNEVLWSYLDWLLKKDKNCIEIDPKYADDVTFIRTVSWKIEKIKRIVPDMLKDGNLLENASKREEYKIPSERGEWKSCKILGSLIDTTKDIQRRKGLTLDTMKTLEKLFKSRTLTIQTKMRIFQAYVSSIFLYNSELWTCTKTICDKIDSFQRRMLRKVLNIRWPNRIRNTTLYERTNVTKWSKVIKKRRLSWLGHLMRLDKRTPARIALDAVLRKENTGRGRKKTTWIDVVKKDLKEGNISIDFKTNRKMFNELEDLCSDRILWRRTVSHMMLNTTSM